MDYVLEVLLERPRRIVDIGRALCTAATAALGIAMWGLVARTGASVIHTTGALQQSPMPTLDTMYPYLWTWWIPESIVGAIAYVGLLGIGIALVAAARSVSRGYH